LDCKQPAFRVRGSGEPRGQQAFRDAFNQTLEQATAKLLPEFKAKLNEWSWVWTVLAPIVPFLYSWNFLCSLLSKTIRWRGVRYQMVTPNMTRVLKR